MKNWKQLGFVCFVVFNVFAFIGCDNNNNDPELIEQSKDIIFGTDKTVTVKYTALPNTTPVWWDTLVLVFDDRKASFDPAHYTLIVQYIGTEGFVAGVAGSKKATVSNTFLLNSDYTTMRASMGPIVGYWIL